MKRAEKYALARLMVKWGYYGVDHQVIIPDYVDVQHIVTLLFNELFDCLQVPRSELDVIADKIILSGGCKNVRK